MGARWTGTAPVGGGVGAEARRCHGGQFGGRDGGGRPAAATTLAAAAAAVAAAAFSARRRRHGTKNQQFYEKSKNEKTMKNLEKIAENN